MQANELQDETAFLQYGQSDETIYYSPVENLEILDSSWNKFPTDESEETRKNRYKFFSFEIELSKDLKRVERQTYGILDWLGDCGGLLDALLAIGELIAGPFSIHAI